jgi:hypothetical protein
MCRQKPVEGRWRLFEYPAMSAYERGFSPVSIEICEPNPSMGLHTVGKYEISFQER